MITWAERAKAAISKKDRGGTAKTDEIPVSSVLAVSSVPAKTISTPLDRLSTVLAVRSSAVLEKYDASIALIEDLDRWCWPRSSAMTGTEIDKFVMRLYRFTNKGLLRTEGEVLADTLVVRDREHDDRRVCLECKHFAGHGAGSWRCGNWQVAGIAIQSRDAQLPADLVIQLQHCNGFTEYLTSTSQGTDNDHDHGHH